MTFDPAYSREPLEPVLLLAGLIPLVCFRIPLRKRVSYTTTEAGIEVSGSSTEMTSRVEKSSDVMYNLAQRDSVSVVLPNSFYVAYSIAGNQAAIYKWFFCYILSQERISMSRGVRACNFWEIQTGQNT